MNTDITELNIFTVTPYR